VREWGATTEITHTDPVVVDQENDRFCSTVKIRLETVK